VSGEAKRPQPFQGLSVGSERGGPPAEPLREPEPVNAIIAKTFALYRRYPLLFLVLALGVIVPYDLVVLIATGSGPLAKNSGLAVNPLLAVFLISPLISALHIHAVAEVRAERTPRLRSIAARGLRVLPTAAATAIMVTLGVLVGLVFTALATALLYFDLVSRHSAVFVQAEREDGTAQAGDSAQAG